MHPSCDSLVSALQEELQEYGALLHLFELQQNHLLRHDSEGFLAVNSQVERQLENLTRSRTLRESLVRSIAAEYARPANGPLSELVDQFPISRRPLLRALLEEINNLLASTHRRAHQNRMLLAQCVDSAREVFAAYQPEVAAPTYSAKGLVYGTPRLNEHLPAAVA